MASLDESNSELNVILSTNNQDTDTVSDVVNIENIKVGVQRKKIVPDLPKEKYHHVFISYAEVDQEFAYQLIERLDRAGYKTCHHNKDFTPGWPITDNIKHCVMGSMKTIVILSEGSIISPWCSYETEITLYMSMEMRKRILIPLAIENCKIPDHLKNLTRIEYYNDKVDWWAKLLDAINAADEVPIFHSDIPAISSKAFEFNPYFTNLDPLVNIKAGYSCLCYSKVDRRYVPGALNRRGIKISQQEYEELKDYINRHVLLKSYVFTNNIGLSIFCFLVVFVFSWIFGFLMIFDKMCPEKNNELNNSVCLTGIVLLLIPIVFLIFCLSCWFKRKKKEKQLHKKTFSEINRRLMKHNVIVTSINDPWFNYFLFHFAYYNCQPCLDHLQYVLENSKQTNPVNPNELVCIANENESECNATQSSFQYKSECGSKNCSIEMCLDENNTKTTTRKKSSESGSRSHHLSNEKEIKTEKDYEEEARSMLLKNSAKYLVLYLLESLPKSEAPRHTQNVICLCEYVEFIEGLVPNDKKKTN